MNDSGPKCARTPLAVAGVRDDLNTCMPEIWDGCPAVFAAFPDALVVTRLDDLTIIEVNLRFTEVTGFSRDESIGSSSVDLGLWATEEDRQNYVEKLRQQRLVRNFDFLLHRKDGAKLNGWLSSVIIEHDGEEFVVSVFKDLTIIKSAEDASQRRLEFEQMLSELSSRFTNLAPEQVDEEITLGLETIRRFFNADSTSLIVVPEDRKTAMMTHLCLVEGGEFPATANTDIYKWFPWVYNRTAVEGECFYMNSLSDLPEGAETDAESLREWGIESFAAIPISSSGTVSHLLSVDLFRPYVWPEEYIPRLRLIAEVFVNALTRKKNDEERKTAYEEIKSLKELLQSEAQFLRAEIEHTHRYDSILGKSSSIKETISLIEQVAPTDSHVLITGETGTGKELVARAIHQVSGRSNRTMVTVNCASLPATLIEGELFGREKGAYTGALTRQMGRFELADKGTIFLDEIGELPLDLQSKLLRVLQEGEFERLGSPKTIKVDIRIIAATNRDLEQSVRSGDFRKDLYYRLAVFPIAVAPLRERTEDIPLLVWAFIDEFAKKMGKKVDSVSKRTMDALVGYHWPGNVRELRNTIERAMIKSSGSTLKISSPNPEKVVHFKNQSLESVERQYILDILEKTNGVIKGPKGAALILGLKPSTLYTKMEKLGITRKS